MVFLIVIIFLMDKGSFKNIMHTKETKWTFGVPALHKIVFHLLMNNGGLAFRTVPFLKLFLESEESMGFCLSKHFFSSL